MQRLAKPVLKALLLAALPMVGAAQIEDMLGGIRNYLLRMPVKAGRLAEHPSLLDTDRCEADQPRNVIVVLTYLKLDCGKYPGSLVIAPRLIHPEKRERVRRMGFPFAQAPLGFELAAYYDALKRYKIPVQLQPPLKQLYGPVDHPRPQENAFGISIRPHDESKVERSTTDTAVLEKRLLGLIPGAEQHRSELLISAGADVVSRRWQREVVGELPVYKGSFNLKERKSHEGGKWEGIAITLDALPGVMAQGVLLKPKDIKAGERRPLVIVQHGLMGRPDSLFAQKTDSADFRTYRNFAEQLLSEGFVVYCPQNPYSGDFRPLQLLANPRGVSLFSFIQAQYRRTLDYLVQIPYVDAGRIVFYGLSYGGATALRIPIFDARIRAIVCGGNFNEWIRKLISPELPYSYLHTKEYEIYEWNQANVASHAELAALGVLLHRTPFLVERGHQDKVGSDEWVEYEFTRLRRYVPDAELSRLAYFNGEHRTDGEAAIPFLKKAALLETK